MHQPPLLALNVAHGGVGLREFLRQVLLGVVLNNRSELGARLRSKLYETSCEIDTGVVVVNPKGFSSGPGCVLYHGCYILNSHGRVTMGEQSHLGAYCYVNACYGLVEIGAGVAIGPGTSIFSYSNHYANKRQVTTEHITRDVRIGDNVLIGAHCVLLPGSTIGANVVLGAGSVVRGALAADAVYAGVPARPVKTGWYG